MAARIGIDTGGTFTDVVRWSRRGVAVHKLPSTPSDPGRAVVDGLAAVRRRPDEVVDVVHGTTVGLNAVLTGDLARTVFVTNQGFEDLVAIGRQERTDLYALEPARPVPPVPRALRVGVRCRRGPAGEAETPLTGAEIARVVRKVRRLRPAAVAVGLLHSPAAPADEQRLARALAAALPGVPVTASAQLLPAFGEYERYSAAILNAAIGPAVSSYLAQLAEGIGHGELRLLRSSLGIMPLAEAVAFPTRAMFSGPAGGVLATAQLARRGRLAHAAAFDMGGTSADVCLVGGAAMADDEARIGGLPLPVPTVGVHTVGCGGGSIAYVDAGGALRVGPRSAGADPGPACYGKADEPTVTDAHLALGHIGPETLLGGAFPVDVDAAVRAIERLGRRLGLGARATAEGILAIADVTMARAILVITAQRAIDPARVPLVAYGGAGGLHAAGLTRRLGMPCAIVPPHPGAFSALGLALAGESAECARAVRLPATATRELRAIGAELARAARGAIATAAHTHVAATVRYRGQGQGLQLPLSPRLAVHFAAEHERRFGFRVDAPLEIVQVTARAEGRPRQFPRIASTAGDGPTSWQRRPPVGGSAFRVVPRWALDGVLRGPAVVEELTATTLVPRGYSAVPSALGIRMAAGAANPRR